MHIREPTPRERHAGKWFVKWGGKEHYLSTDPQTAKNLFYSPTSPHPGSLSAWQAWARQRATPGSHSHRAASSDLRPALVDVAKDMIADYARRGRPDTAGYYRNALAHFMQVHGLADLVELASTDARKQRYTPPIVPLLNAYITDLTHAPKKTRLAPKTINHEVNAVQRLFNWASEHGRCPAVLWKGVQKLPTRRGTPQVRPIEEITSTILALGERDPDLLPWLILTYLCCLRPSETYRLIANMGEWLTIRDLKGHPLPALSADGSKGGVFRLHVHKGSWRGEGSERFIVVTPEAAHWLRIARPIWTARDSYSAACYEADAPWGPSILRDSAASHLLSMGVALADVQILLGHLPPGEWKSYANIPWPALLLKAARITVRPALDARFALQWKARLPAIGDKTISRTARLAKLKPRALIEPPGPLRKKTRTKKK